MLSPKGNVPQRAAVGCSSYPLHELHISGAPDAHRSFCFLTLLEQGYYSFFYAYNQVDEDSTEVKFQVLLGLGGNNFLQNLVLLYGSTWLPLRECLGGKMLVVRVLIDLLEAVSITWP